MMKTGLLFVALLTSMSISAGGPDCQNGCQHGGWQLTARIGYNSGGTAPLGLPATIRSLEAYHLTPSVMVGADAMIPLKHKWGVLTGLYVENKGMDGEVTTKGYRRIVLAQIAVGCCTVEILVEQHRQVRSSLQQQIVMNLIG